MNKNIFQPYICTWCKTSKLPSPHSLLAGGVDTDSDWDGGTPSEDCVDATKERKKSESVHDILHEILLGRLLDFQQFGKVCNSKC